MANPFVLGVIPVRGGSKSIPRKNIRLLNGIPLLIYTIEAARQSSLLSHVVTSTEDKEISMIAHQAGCVVIDRPKELARDETPTLPVIQHAVQVIEHDLSQQVDYLVILQVTTPFRNGEDIDRSIEKLILSGADSVVSVCQITSLHPWKIKRIVDDRLVPYLENEIEGTRRQDLPPAYIRNGGLYAIKRDVLMLQNSIFGQDCRPYVMPPERSIDINNELDFIFAEAILGKIAGSQA